MSIKNFYNLLFKNISLLAIIISFIFLIVLFTSIIKKGYRAFFSNYLTVTINLAPDSFNVDNPNKNYTFNKTTTIALKQISKEYNLKPLTTAIFSINIHNTLNKYLKKHRDKLNTKIKIPLLLSSNADTYLKGYKEAKNNLTQETIDFLSTAKDHGLIEKKFNFKFFTNRDSRYPEIAGINGALKGTLVTIVLTLLFSFIIGVATALYIEEYLKKGATRSIIEININNLAAVPSIIFGLLGLSIFQNILGVPRSSPLLASMVLTLMILPNIIVYSQLAISTVPSSIKEAAYGIGASKNQVIFTQIFPLALPGIITGLIISISRALGETAPLLIIGMYIFVANTSFSIVDAASTLSTQILIWFNMPELGFIEKTSAAIMILLIITISINLIASYIRKKFTKKL